MLKSKQILLDRYQLQEQLGERPNRQTWLAIDLETKEEKKQQVVIKLLVFGGQTQWQDLKLFEREAQILRELECDRIPKYYDYFTIDDCFLWFALVEEYISGSSLQDLLDRGTRFTEQEVKNIATELLNILLYLHQLKPQILHRDIKPSNIILGENKQVYLIDFGAVQDKSVVEGASFTVVGTYGYTPIEQFGGRTVPASDLYALGATLIHLLTGVPPADLPQKDLRIHFKDVISLSDRFSLWLTKMTEPAIEKRFNSANDALEKLQSSTPIISKRINYDYALKPRLTRIRLFGTSEGIKIIIPTANLLPKIVYISWFITQSIVSICLGLLFFLLFCYLLFQALLSISSGKLFLGIGLFILNLISIIVTAFIVNFFSKHRYLRIINIGNKATIDHQIFGIYHKSSQFNLEDLNNIFIVSETKIEEDSNKKLIVKLANKKVELAKNLTQAECEWLLSEIKNCLENN